LKIFGLCLPVLAVEICMMQAAFACRLHWQAIFSGMFCTGMSIGMTFFFFPRFGIVLIPFVLLCQKSLKVSILYALLNRKLNSSGRAGTLKEALAIA
jgi:peptidoglycan biosynthesis protein MviN/MurJ (putative lipid II flippase)